MRCSTLSKNKKFMAQNMLPISKPFQIPTGHLFYYNRNNIQMEELKQFFKNEDSEISDSSYEKRDEIYSNIETKTCM